MRPLQITAARHLLAIGLGLCGCTPPAAAAQPVTSLAVTNRYELRALPYASLFYQLDCLAGQGYCSESNYRALWNSLGWSAADDQRLKDWQSLRTRYNRQIQLSQPGAGYALPPRFDGVRIWDKVREATFNASDAQGLALNLAAVMRPTDAEALIKLMESFMPRFGPWWQSTGHVIAEAGAQGFGGLLQAQELPRLIDQASRFYKASLSSESVLGFNFVPRPEAGGNTFNGEQVENQSLIEVREKGAATANLDVALHEFCHYLYARADANDEKALIARFAAEGSPDAIGAYNLLNEVIATAIGNGLAGRLIDPARFAANLAKPGSLYNDDFIDPLAKAVYPRVEKALSSGETLYDASFFADYLAAARQTLGARLHHPQLLLRTAAAAYGGELAPVLTKLQQRMRIGAVWGANGLDANARGVFETFSALSGVILLKPDQLARLSEWESLLGKDAIAKIRQQSGSFIYGIQRKPNAWVFVLVAADAAGFDPLIEKLATASEPIAGLF